MENTMIIRHIPVPLTDAEKNELHDEMCAYVVDRDRLKDLLDEFNKKHEEIIKSREAKISENAATLHAGHVMRPISCQQEIDLTLNYIKVTRIDTGEILEDRAMTAQERTSLIDQRNEATTTDVATKPKPKSNRFTPPWKRPKR